MILKIILYTLFNFLWEKFWPKCLQDLLHRGNLQDSTPISLIKSYRFYIFLRTFFEKCNIP